MRFLLLVTLGMAFTGQIMRFDQDAYWGLGIGASIASRVPVIGPWAVNLMLGGPIIAGATLSRFFALHVFVVPGLLIALVGSSICLMVLKLGVNELAPSPGYIVRRATYMREYHELTQKQGVPFVPNAVWKDIIFSGLILPRDCCLCAIHFGPFGPSGQPDPTIIGPAPRPDFFFFLWLYALLSFLPPAAETPILLIGPAIRSLLVLLALPFVAGEGEKAGSAGPIAVLCDPSSRSGRSALDSASRAHAAEPHHGRLEQRADPATIRTWTHVLGTGGCTGFSSPARSVAAAIR